MSIEINDMEKYKDMHFSKNKKLKILLKIIDNKFKDVIEEILIKSIS